MKKINIFLNASENVNKIKFHEEREMRNTTSFNKYFGLLRARGTRTRVTRDVFMYFVSELQCNHTTIEIIKFSRDRLFLCEF